MSVALTILFLLVCLQMSVLAGSPLNVSYMYPSAVPPPTNLLVTNTRVFVAIGNTLLRFRTDFSNPESFVWSAAISGIIETNDPQAPVWICLNDGYCNLLTIYSSPTEFDPEYYQSEINNAMITLSRVQDSFYVTISRSYGSQRREFEICLFRGLYSYFIARDVCDTKTISKPSFISRNFTHSFSDGDFVYFIMMDTSTMLEDSGIKLMRKCHVENVTESTFRATFEIKLDCGPLTANTTIVSFSKLNQTIILGLHDRVSGNRFCVFNTTDVNKEITEAYEYCKAGNYTFQLPWFVTSRSTMCEDFSQVSYTVKLVYLLQGQQPHNWLLFSVINCN